MLTHSLLRLANRIIYPRTPREVTEIVMRHQLHGGVREPQRHDLALGVAWCFVSFLGLILAGVASFLYSAINGPRYHQFIDVVLFVAILGVVGMALAALRYTLASIVLRVDPATRSPEYVLSRLLRIVVAPSDWDIVLPVLVTAIIVALELQGSGR